MLLQVAPSAWRLWATPRAPPSCLQRWPAAPRCASASGDQERGCRQEECRGGSASASVDQHSNHRATNLRCGTPHDSNCSVAVMLAPAVHMRHIHSPPLNILAALGADRVRAGRGWGLEGWAGLRTPDTRPHTAARRVAEVLMYISAHCAGLIAWSCAALLPPAPCCASMAPHQLALPAAPAGLQPAGPPRVPAHPGGRGRAVQPGLQADAAGLRIHHHRCGRAQHGWVARAGWRAG